MIRWEMRDQIAFLTLDRDGARNALPIAGWDALAAATAEIARSGARCAILSSARQGIFSAGADLTEFQRLIAEPAQRTRFREAMHAGVEGVANLPMPVIAAVNGGCFGAAVALTLACDIVVAGDAAAFATTPARLGLSYPAGDVARLRARVGHGRAALMLFTGDRVEADQALAYGLAHVRVPDALAGANDIARSVGDNIPEAVTKLKRVLRHPENPRNDMDFEMTFGSPAFAQRLHAFLGRAR